MNKHPYDIQDEHEAIRIAIRRVADILGKTPTQKEYKTERNSNESSLEQITYRLGNWSDAVKQAGLEPNPFQVPPRRPEITKQQLADEFIHVANKLKCLPSMNQFRANASYSWTPYKTNWGSWKQAVNSIIDEHPDKFDFDVKPSKSRVKSLRKKRLQFECPILYEPSVPATGNQIKIAVMIWSKYENDKIVEEWEFPDMIGMLQQVNILMPSHESAVPALRRSLTEEYEWGDNVFTKSDSCNPHANKAIVQKVFNGLWGKENQEIANQYISSDLIIHAPNVPDLKNLNNLHRYLANIRKAANLKVSMDDMIGERDLVAVKWSAGPSPNGKQITVEGTVIFKIFEDKIREAWLSADIKGLYEQLGLLVFPKP